MAEINASKFNIRVATKDDLFYFLILTKEFQKESSYSVWDKDKVTETFLACLDNNNAVVYLGTYDNEPVSFIFGLVTEGWSSREKVAIELGWYTSKDYRGKVNSVGLLKQFEKWSKDAGATVCSMSSITDMKSLTTLYKRCGYSTKELTFIKRI